MNGVRMDNPSTPLYIYTRTRERRAVFRKACVLSDKGHDRDVCLLHHPHLLAFLLQIGSL